MKKNLLIVEDDEAIRSMMCIYFNNKYNIFEAETGKDAIMLFRSEQIDLIFLDLMLPEIDGFKVCEILREKSDVPVIMITAKAQEEDKLKGYEYGADEYVVKPFSLKVLDARADMLLKRVSGKVSKNSRKECLGMLEIDHDTGRISLDGKDVMLTKKEHDLLLLLVLNKGIILSKEQILDRVWGMEYEGDPRTVDTTIKRLREKLQSSRNYIETVRGRGYRFIL